MEIKQQGHFNLSKKKMKTKKHTGNRNQSKMKKTQRNISNRMRK